MPRVTEHLKRWAEERNIDPQSVVLCSKSDKTKNNLGNYRYNHTIQMSAPKYAKAENKQMKMKITHQIVDELPFTFVKEKNGEYQIPNKSFAYDKVGHALRTQIKKLANISTIPKNYPSMRSISDTSDVSQDSFKNDITRISKQNAWER